MSEQLSDLDQRLLSLRQKEGKKFREVAEALVDEKFKTKTNKKITTEWVQSRFHFLTHRNGKVPASTQVVDLVDGAKRKYKKKKKEMMTITVAPDPQKIVAVFGGYEEVQKIIYGWVK